MAPVAAGLASRWIRKRSIWNSPGVPCWTGRDGTYRSVVDAQSSLACGPIPNTVFGEKPAR